MKLTLVLGTVALLGMTAPAPAGSGGGFIHSPPKAPTAIVKAPIPKAPVKAPAQVPVKK